MFQKAKEKYYRKVYEQHKDCLNDISDLFGDGYDGMSNLFYLCNKRYLHWLDNDPEVAVSEKEILFRRKFYKVLQKIGSSALKCTQVFEDRKLLDDPTSMETDEGIVLPESYRCTVKKVLSDINIPLMVHGTRDFNNLAVDRYVLSMHIL